MAELALTKEQILSMPAGPEMDALVAERVMGCKPKKGYFGYDCTCPKTKGNYKRPHSDEELHEDKCHSTSGLNCDDSALAGYSTDMAAAMEVAKVRVEQGRAALVVNTPNSRLLTDSEYREWAQTQFEIQVEPGDVFVIFSAVSGVANQSTPRTGIAKAKTFDELPLAICRAALISTIPYEAAPATAER